MTYNILKFKTLQTTTGLHPLIVREVKKLPTVDQKPSPLSGTWVAGLNKRHDNFNNQQ